MAIATIKLNLEDLEFEAIISYAQIKGYFDCDLGTKTEVTIEDVQLHNVTEYRVRVLDGFFAMIDESEKGATEAMFTRVARELLENRNKVAEQIVEQMDYAECCA